MILSTVPILPAIDMEESKQFYIDGLGFEIVGDYGDYVLLANRGVEVHLVYLPDRHVAENTACYVRVSSIESLHSTYDEKGVVRFPLELKPWGMKEFGVIDPSGNLLRFGERADSAR